MSIYFPQPVTTHPTLGITPQTTQISYHPSNSSITIPIHISLNPPLTSNSSTALPFSPNMLVPKQDPVKINVPMPQPKSLSHVIVQPSGFVTQPSQAHFVNLQSNMTATYTPSPSVLQTVASQMPAVTYPMPAPNILMPATVALEKDPKKFPAKVKSVRCRWDYVGEECFSHKKGVCGFFHEDEGTDVITFSCPSKRHSLKQKDCPNGLPCTKIACRELHPFEVKQLFQNKNIKEGWALLMWNERKARHMIIQVLPMKYTVFLSRVPELLSKSRTPTSMPMMPIQTVHATAQRVATISQHHLPHAIATVRPVQSATQSVATPAQTQTMRRTTTVTKKPSNTTQQLQNTTDKAKTFACMWGFIAQKCLNKVKRGLCNFVHPEEDSTVWRWSKIAVDNFDNYKVNECARKEECINFVCANRHPNEYRRKIIREGKVGCEMIRWSKWTEAYHVVCVYEESDEKYLRQIPRWENRPSLFPKGEQQSSFIVPNVAAHPPTVAVSTKQSSFNLQKTFEKIQNVLEVRLKDSKSAAVGNNHSVENTLRCQFEFLNQECSLLEKNQCLYFHHKKGVVMHPSEIEGDKTQFKRFGCTLDANCYKPECACLHPGELRRKIVNVNTNGWELLRWSLPKKCYVIMRVISVNDEQYIQKIPIWEGKAPTAMTLVGNAS